MLGPRFCARAFSSCGKRGPLLIAVRGPLTIAASPAAEHRLQTRRLSSCGPWAQLLRGTWDLPRPGFEPVSLHWQADSQPLRHQGSPSHLHLTKNSQVTPVCSPAKNYCWVSTLLLHQIRCTGRKAGERRWTYRNRQVVGRMASWLRALALESGTQGLGFTSYETIIRLLNLSEPQFPHL